MNKKNINTIMAILLFISPALSQAKWESYICQITERNSEKPDVDQIVGTAYLNFDLADQNGKGTLRVWNKDVGGSFSDDVEIKGRGLKHAYLTGARFSARFEHGLGNAGSGPFNDKDLEEEISIISKKPVDQSIYCDSIDPIVDAEK